MWASHIINHHLRPTGHCGAGSQWWLGGPESPRYPAQNGGCQGSSAAHHSRWHSPRCPGGCAKKTIWCYYYNVLCIYIYTVYCILYIYIILYIIVNYTILVCICGTKSLRTITVVWLDGMNTTQLLFSSFAHSLYVAASSVQNPLSLIGIPITTEDTPQDIYIILYLCI